MTEPPPLNTTLEAPAGMWPAGALRDRLRRRRRAVLALNAGTYAALLAAMAAVAGAGGWTLVDMLLLSRFAGPAPRMLPSLARLGRRVGSPPSVGRSTEVCLAQHPRRFRLCKGWQSAETHSRVVSVNEVEIPGGIGVAI